MFTSPRVDALIARIDAAAAATCSPQDEAYAYVAACFRELRATHAMSEAVTLIHCSRLVSGLFLDTEEAPVKAVYSSVYNWIAETESHAAACERMPLTQKLIRRFTDASLICANGEHAIAFRCCADMLQRAEQSCPASDRACILDFVHALQMTILTMREHGHDERADAYAEALKQTQSI